MMLPKTMRISDCANGNRRSAAKPASNFLGLPDLLGPGEGHSCGSDSHSVEANHYSCDVINDSFLLHKPPLVSLINQLQRASQFVSCDHAQPYLSSNQHELTECKTRVQS